MKHFASSFALTLGLLVPVLAACGGATTGSVPGGDGTASGASSSAPVDSSESDVKAGAIPTCASVGGSCVGLSPSSCTDGHWADASKATCGGGGGGMAVGVGCCVSCPVLSPPAPSFCPDGKIVPKEGANGCIGGYDCVKVTPADCPELVQPPPGFCPGGSVVPHKDASTGCVTGFDCVPAPANACTAAGGTCVGLAPSSCAAGHWADAATHSCGVGVGVGCCIP
jgi:hypothetical protein